MRPSGPWPASRSMRSTIASRRCVGRDEQLAVLDLAAVAGEVVEQLGEVGAELGVGGEQAEVLVEGWRSCGL